MRDLKAEMFERWHELDRPIAALDAEFAEQALKRAHISVDQDPGYRGNRCSGASRIHQRRDELGAGAIWLASLALCHGG
ncbi:hypothetical protein ACRBEV_22805 [Methylobacterium phyllosphaerae]